MDAPEGTARSRALARRRVLDPYEVLQISPHASPEVIRAAYRALARRAHPDVNLATDTTLEMREINAAFQLLSDPHRRAQYDAVARPVRLQLARRLQAERRQASIGPLGGVVRERVVRAPVSRPSGFARIRGPLVAIVALLASAVLVVIVTAWAIDDLTDERVESGLLGAGRFATQTSVDGGVPVQLFVDADAPSELP
jgi:hypothetical protein